MCYKYPFARWKILSQSNQNEYIIYCILLLFPIFYANWVHQKRGPHQCLLEENEILNFSQVNYIDDIEINKFKNIYIDYCGD